MSEDMVVMAPRLPAGEMQSLATRDLQARVRKVHEVMGSVMRQGVHYGLIPGVKKPSLFQPGAELLRMAFQLATEYAVEDLSGPDVVRYRVTTKLRHIPSGEYVGEGIGECSSDEEKYRWRKAVCEQEYEATPSDRKRVKWVAPYQKKPFSIQQVRVEPADIANTVLKMAVKRADVGAIRAATAASDIFTQDVEDMPREYLQQDAPAPAPTRPPIPEVRERVRVINGSELLQMQTHPVTASPLAALADESDPGFDLDRARTQLREELLRRVGGDVDDAQMLLLGITKGKDGGGFEGFRSVNRMTKDWQFTQAWERLVAMDAAMTPAAAEREPGEDG